ncbi:MAG TPA: hypothetical protein PKY81_16335 [bacterium]|nr:hypothetical protein [bacterium]
MKKIVFVGKDGQYNAIGYMLIHIAEAFKCLGYEIEILSYSILKHNNFRADSDFIFSINAHSSVDNFNAIIEKINCPWISYFVDSPFYHYDKLNVISSKFIPVVMDINHLGITKKFFRQPLAFFMPMGAPEAVNDGQTIADINSRKIPLVFFGSMPSLNECWRQISVIFRNNEDILNWFKAFFNILSRKSELLYTDLFFDEMKKLFFEDVIFEKDKEEDLVIHLYICIDKLFRTNNRIKILNSIKDLPLTVFGNMNLEDVKENKFIVRQPITFNKTLEFMKHSVIAFNISPCMNQAISERISYSMSLGNVLVSDKNEFIKNNIEPFGAGYFFEGSELSNLKNKVIEILNSPGLKKKYSESAYNEFKLKHTWKRRVINLTNDLKNSGYDI